MNKWNFTFLYNVSTKRNEGAILADDKMNKKTKYEYPTL